MYPVVSCPGSVTGPVAGRYVLPDVSEIVSVPAGRAAVPVTIRKFPTVLPAGNVAEIEDTDASLPFTAFCTSRIGVAVTACVEKLIADALAPLIVTGRLAGVNEKPALA